MTMRLAIRFLRSARSSTAKRKIFSSQQSRYLHPFATLTKQQNKSTFYRHNALKQNTATYSSIAVPHFVTDLIKTGQLNPPNPFLQHIQDVREHADNHADSAQSFPPLLKFSTIEPRHLEPALVELLKEFEEKTESFELKLKESLSKNHKLEYEEVLLEMDRIDFPLRHFGNLLELMRSVGFGGKEIKEIAPKLFLKIKEYNFSDYSSILVQALEKLLIQIEDEIDAIHDENNFPLLKERKQLLTRIISQYRLSGGDLLTDKTFLSYKARLEEIESKFSRHYKGNNGNRPPAREAIPLMYEILSIKKSMAKIMGYSSFAEASFKHNMAPDLNIVNQLHDIVSEKVQPLATSIVSGETAMLNAGVDGHLEFNMALKGLFNLCHRLFGIRIEASDGNSKSLDIWDRDVRLYHVYDEDNEDAFLGSFYLDPYARPYKQGGEWMGSIVDKRDNQMKPLVYLSCYMNPPVWDDSPIRMSFSDLKGLFHEFGHMLQFLLTDVEYGPISGPDAIEKDASEFVAQFMEYWLYEKSVLSSLFPTDYPIDDIQEELVIQRHHESALKFPVQIFLSQMEIDLHSIFDPDGEESIFAFQKRLAEKYIPHDIPMKGDVSSLDTIFQSNADGIHVSSYRYLWSEILSADAFHAFQEASDKGEGMEKVGRQFRESILKVGGSVGARESFSEFRGRDAKVDALLLYHGLNEKHD